jgi:hypothetical protein
MRRGIVDEDVDAAELVDDGLDQPVPVLTYGDVKLVSESPLERARDLFGCTQAKIGYDD